MVNVENAAGETVYVASSDAEAVRWWMDNGRSGDTLADTGERMADLVPLLELDD